MSLGRTILIFLGAMIFSTLLWAYVRLSTPYDAEVDLPVKLTAPRGFALSGGLPERLHARVRGAGWQILLMNFAKNAGFQFDLAQRMVSDSTPLILRAEEVTHSIMLPSELHVVKVEPDSLSISFARRAQKRVPIVPALDVTPGKGYVIIGEPKVIPATIVVEGARAVLDSLVAFPTKSISVHGAKEDIDQQVELSDTLDNMLTLSSAQKVSVHVEVQAVGERVLAGIPMTVEALPPQYEVLLIPNKVNVTLRGGVDELGQLIPTAIRVRLPYDPVLFDTAKTVAPLADVPKGLSLLAIDPPRIKFIIRKKAGTINGAP